MTTGKTVRHWYHCRKGLISGVVIREDDEWITIELTSEAGAFLPENVREPGERLTFRRSLVTERSVP